VKKFFPRETELEKLRNAREFFLKEKIWENPARIFCLSPVQRPEENL
jgi:hypothetical protein